MRAASLRMAAGSHSMTVPVTARSGPTGAGAGRCGPVTAPSTMIAESANVAHAGPSWPVVAEAGRSGPEREAVDEKVGPAGLEPASTRTQVAECAQDSENDPDANSTSDSTLVAELAATVRQAHAGGQTTLARRLQADIARLLAQGGWRGQAAPAGACGRPRARTFAVSGKRRNA